MLRAPRIRGSCPAGLPGLRLLWGPHCAPRSATAPPGLGGGPHPKGEPGTQEWPTSHLVPWEGSAARDLMQQGKALSQKHRKKSPEKSWQGRGEMQGMGLVFSEAVTGRTGLG